MTKAEANLLRELRAWWKAHHRMSLHVGGHGCAGSFYEGGELCKVCVG